MLHSENHNHNPKIKQTRQFFPSPEQFDFWGYVFVTYHPRNVKQVLQKSYPFKKAKCEDNCFVCMSEGSGNCRKSNVSYEIVCDRVGCKDVYIGETSRNAFL